MIILDVGSGNTLTSPEVARRMVREIEQHVPPGLRGGVILKAQLFESAPPNVPLTHETFEALRMAGKSFRDVTASVFDRPSLRYLTRFNPGFIKIANRPELYPLIVDMPRYVFPLVSCADWQTCLAMAEQGYIPLACVSEYPAGLPAYEAAFRVSDLNAGISDHTVNLDLVSRYQPAWYERHIRLPDTTGPDAGPFAILPSDLGGLFDAIKHSD